MRTTAKKLAIIERNAQMCQTWRGWIASGKARTDGYKFRDLAAMYHVTESTAKKLIYAEFGAVRGYAHRVQVNSNKTSCPFRDVAWMYGGVA